MTAEIEKLREDLRALKKFPQTALPDYATDPVIQCRLGRMLAEITARIRIRPLGESEF